MSPWTPAALLSFGKLTLRFALHHMKATAFSTDKKGNWNSACLLWALNFKKWCELTGENPEESNGNDLKSRKHDNEKNWNGLFSYRYNNYVRTLLQMEKGK